jgi:hypothetical protein
MSLLVVHVTSIDGVQRHTLHTSLAPMEPFVSNGKSSDCSLANDFAQQHISRLPVVVVVSRSVATWVTWLRKVSTGK